MKFHTDSNLSSNRTRLWSWEQIECTVYPDKISPCFKVCTNSLDTTQKWSLQSNFSLCIISHNPPVPAPLLRPVTLSQEVVTQVVPDAPEAFTVAPLSVTSYQTWADWCGLALGVMIQYTTDF